MDNINAVVNCFQISIFAVHEQLGNNRYDFATVVNCFQISIFAVHEQLIYSRRLYQHVVNCFQISIFAVHEQHVQLIRMTILRCELLSN